MSLLEEIRIGRALRPLAFNQDVKALIAVDGVDPCFLTYAALAQRRTLLGIVHQAAHGTGVLASDRLKALAIPLPPLEEQRRIAGVLGVLDDLIESNQRLRENAEHVGRTLVVDLASGGLAAVKGEPVPEGWEIIKLGAAASTIESGRRPRGGVAGIAFGTPSIGAESISGLGVFDFGKTKFVPPEFAATMRRGVLESRDVLVYKDGGKPGEFRPHVAMFGNGFPYKRMTINEHVYRVRAAEPLSEPYLYFWLSTPELLSAMATLGTGAAIPGLNSTNFKSLPVAVPPGLLRERLFPVLDSLVDIALGAATESRDLERVRDELLPLLLSGAIRVDEVVA